MKRIVLIFAMMILGFGFAERADAQTIETAQTIDATGVADRNAGVSALEGIVTMSRGQMIMGGRALSNEEMAVLFPENAYRSAVGGGRMRRAGKGMIIGGSILTGVGIIACAASAVGTTVNSVGRYGDGAYYGYDASMLALVSGTFCTATGTSLLAGGIALYCVGQGRMRRAAAAYNRTLRPGYALNLGSTGNDFGLYLNF